MTNSKNYTYGYELSLGDKVVRTATSCSPDVILEFIGSKNGEQVFKDAEGDLYYGSFLACYYNVIHRN